MSELKNKDYWPHPATLRNDRRMKRVMKDLPGGVGYGAVVITMERLRCEENFSYPISDLDLLADEFHISLPILQTIVSKYGFFELTQNEGDEEVFFSPLLNQLMQPYQEQKKKAQIAGKISAEKRKIKQHKQLEELSLLSSIQQPLNTRSTDKIRTEEIRTEENKKDLSISDFTIFKQFVSKKYKNKNVCSAPATYAGHVTISITSTGFLHNNFNHKDLNGHDAKAVWKYLFENQHLLLPIGATS